MSTTIKNHSFFSPANSILELFRRLGTRLRHNEHSILLGMGMLCMLATLFNPFPIWNHVSLRDCFIYWPSLFVLAYYSFRQNCNPASLATRDFFMLPVGIVLIWTGWCFISTGVDRMSGMQLVTGANCELFRIAMCALVCAASYVSVQRLLNTFAISIFTGFVGIIIGASAVCTFFTNGSDLATGGFGNKQLLGGFLACLSPLTLCFLLTSQGRTQKMVLCSSFFVLSGLFLTGNRISIIASLCANICVFVLGLKDVSLRKDIFERKRLLWLLGVSIVAVALASYGFSPHVQGRFTDASLNNAIRPRVKWAQTCVHMFVEQPIIGKGIGSFSSTQSRNNGTGPFYLNDIAHNEYLQIAAEQGVIGLGLYVMLLTTFFICAWRAYRNIQAKTTRWMALGILGGGIAYSLDGLANPAWRFGYVCCIFYVFIGWISAFSRIAISPANEKQSKEFRIQHAGRLCAIVGIFTFMCMAASGSYEAFYWWYYNPPPTFVTGVTPNPVPGSNSRQSFTINGENFDANCTVTLRDLTTGEIFPNRTQLSHSSTGITLTPIFGTAPDNWSVEVFNSAGKSCGAYSFSVQAPVSIPTISGFSQDTITAQTGLQSLTINGTYFATGSQVEVRSLIDGTYVTVPGPLNSDGSITFTTILSAAGNYSVKVIRPDGQKTQPKLLSVVSDSTSFRLSFPLRDGGKTPYTARIGSIFDHAMTWDKKYMPGSGTSGDLNNGVVTFAGDNCTNEINGTNAWKAISNGNILHSYYKENQASLLIKDYIAYDSGNVAFYDGHNGYDYPATQGTNVYAAAAGTATVSYDASNGNMVTLTHDSTGYTTIYCHLDSPAQNLKTGDYIMEGALIGKVGNTGASQGFHLHFTVRNNYKSVDPYGWLLNPDDDPYFKLNKIRNIALWRDAPGSSFNVTPLAFDVPTTGSGTPFAVSISTASQSYTASVNSDSPWLAITGGASGSGNTTLYFTATANSGYKRVGRITVTGSNGDVRIISVSQDTAPTIVNPTETDIAAQIKIKAKEHQIPAVILAAIAYRESTWQQFDENGNPWSSATSDVGLMQINIQHPVVTMDTSRVSTDWIYNLEIGCQILKKKWSISAVDTVSPWDDKSDTDPAILENWYYPIAWYNGEGTAARAYVSTVWDYIKKPTSPISNYFAPIPDLGDPGQLAGFPNTIYSKVPTPHMDNLATADPVELISHGMYTLKLLRRADATIHRWNWDSGSTTPALSAFSVQSLAFTATTMDAPIDISEAIGTEPTSPSYGEWATALGDATSGPLADADGDGVPNLLEYTLGGDPNDSSSAPRPLVSMNGNTLEMVAVVSNNAIGQTLDVESSTDCVHWTSAGVTPSVISENTVSQTLKWSVPAPGSKQFLRLRVIAP